MIRFEEDLGGIIDSTTLITGFTIQNGYTHENDQPYDKGGGMYLYQSSPTLIGVTFSGNTSADAGGGMYINGDSNDDSYNMTDVTFNENSAYIGGGMYVQSASPTLTDVTFNNNSAPEGGGAIYMKGSSSTLTNVTFDGNSVVYDCGECGGGAIWATESNLILTNIVFNGNGIDYEGYGGAMYIDSGETTLTNVIFSENYTDWVGGGLYVNSVNDLPLTNVQFINNEAGVGGGGMFIEGSNSNITLTDVEFIGNTAEEGGGVVYREWSSSGNLALSNVIFSENSAEIAGGLCDGEGGNISLINTTFVGNTASGSYGGGAIATGGSSANLRLPDGPNYTLINTILWDNTPNAISYLYNSANIEITYSDIQGGEAGIQYYYGADAGNVNWLEGNIDADPLFTDPENGDYTLQPTSPCIDAGDPSSSLDPDGTIADMGAYYFHQESDVYGCTDPEACNYDETANVDDGNCLENDCSGECGGSAIADECGVCGGNSSCVDCTGTPWGNAVEDFCGICNGENIEIDCPSCDNCAVDYTSLGSECCDTAWDEYGINCTDLEANYNWTCDGCECPGDEVICGDGLCTSDEGCDNCETDCGVCGASCNSCVYDYTNYVSGDNVEGSQCCDTIQDNYGVSCISLEDDYSWNCSGCNCLDCDESCFDSSSESWINNCDYWLEITDWDCEHDMVISNCPASCGLCDPCEWDSYVNDGGDDSCGIGCETPIGEEESTILGCTDGNASNYNPYADIDNGSCIWLVNYGNGPYCGDGACNGNETYDTCTSDCYYYEDCVDDSNYYDCDGPTFDCNWYSNYPGSCGNYDGCGSNACPNCANEACCICQVQENTISEGDGTRADGRQAKKEAKQLGHYFTQSRDDCGGIGPNVGCDGVCFSDLEDDNCGVCGGDGSSCQGVLGDINGDGYLDVLDVVITINIVLVDGYDEIGDMNGDGQLDILDVVILINLILNGEGVIMDIDGNVYLTVQIGDQLWMAENLKVTHYNDSTLIPTGNSNSEWAELETGAYAVYDDDPSNADIYGNLYNWYVVGDDRGVCPDGWHVPSDGEYIILTDYLGGTSVAGGKMKEAGLDHWNYYSDEITEEATNESGFTALPAGYRDYNFGSGAYLSMGYDGFFWSSSEGSSSEAFRRRMSYNFSSVSRYSNWKQGGFSIRCLGD